MKKALIVGGANGIGLAIATELACRKECEKVYIVDKATVPAEYRNPKFEEHLFDLTSDDYALFDQFQDCDTLMITAGFGRLALFRDISEETITQSFQVNTLPTLRILKRFYSKLESTEDFYCGVMVSIADTINGFNKILDGEVDYLPEQAFLNVGTIEDAIAKGERILEMAGKKS